MTDFSLGELLQSCRSTNEVAKERGLLGSQQSPHGTWVSSRVQTEGKGRLGNKWISCEGNLFLSVILRPAHTRHWTWFPMLGAVGVLNLLNSGAFTKSNFPRFSLKWPNDLWMEGKKFGGVLCEVVSSRSGDSFLVLGLGLNCSSHPEELEHQSISLGDVSLSDQLRLPLVGWISKASLRLDQEGPEFLREAYHRWSELREGDFICWQNRDRSFEGRVQGLGPHAELQVLSRDGTLKSLYSEEVFKVRGHGPSFNSR